MRAKRNVHKTLMSVLLRIAGGRTAFQFERIAQLTSYESDSPSVSVAAD
jgi:hypothetical protein